MARLPALTIGSTLLGVAILATLMAAFTPGATIGVTISCIAILSVRGASEALEARKRREPPPGRGEVAGLCFGAFLESLALVVMSTLTFLAISSFYSIAGAGGRTFHTPSRVSILGSAYRLIMALVVARFLRLSLSGGPAKGGTRGIAFVLWMLLGTAVLGLFTSLIFRDW